MEGAETTGSFKAGGTQRASLLDYYVAKHPSVYAPPDEFSSCFADLGKPSLTVWKGTSLCWPVRDV